MINILKRGDCLQLISEIENESIDLVATDPPYLISYKTNMRTKTKQVRDKSGKLVDHDFRSEIQNDANPQLITDIISDISLIILRNVIDIDSFLDSSIHLEQKISQKNLYNRSFALSIS